MARTKATRRAPTIVKKNEEVDFLEKGAVDPEPDNKRRKVVLDKTLPNPPEPHVLPPGPAFVAIGVPIEYNDFLKTVYEMYCDNKEEREALVKLLLGFVRAAREDYKDESLVDTLLRLLIEGKIYNSWENDFVNATLLEISKISKTAIWKCNSKAYAFGAISGAVVIFRVF